MAADERAALSGGAAGGLMVAAKAVAWARENLGVCTTLVTLPESTPPSLPTSLVAVATLPSPPPAKLRARPSATSATALSKPTAWLKALAMAEPPPAVAHAPVRRFRP